MTAMDLPGEAPQAVPVDADRALTELFRAHYTGLLRLAVLLADDAATAEDLVQDAFARMHQRWGRLAEPDKALAYLRASVVNGSRSRLRRLRTARRHPERPLPEQASAEEIAVARSEHAEVLAALDALPRRQRQVLVLRYYADLSEAEIALAMGISAGAVKSHAHRGIAALEHALEGSR